MMNLLKDIQAQSNAADLLVAHDLATVRHMADYTAVMYLGKIVEYAPTQALFDNVTHPYTKALFSAVLPPRPDRREEEIGLAGEGPSPRVAPPRGAAAALRRGAPLSWRNARRKSRRCARLRRAIWRRAISTPPEA